MTKKEIVKQIKAEMAKIRKEFDVPRWLDIDMHPDEAFSRDFYRALYQVARSLEDAVGVK